MAWKSIDGKTKASNLITQLETLIKGMLNKQTLLDIIRHFIVFDKSKKKISRPELHPSRPSRNWHIIISILL
jgi:Type I site-specific restriction-modification system, R (restriction) subunit and related helicases